VPPLLRGEKGPEEPAPSGEPKQEGTP